jgi:GT2 family glycosyltransferase
MKTGIVILNYNDSNTTAEIIDRIKNYNVLDLIVVVDNKSADDSYTILKEYENEKIKVIQADSNNGYGAGNNIGARYLVENNVDYIIISNPDIIFEEADIINLCTSFEQENVAVVAPTINEHGNLNRGWKFKGAIWDAFSNINYVGRLFKKKQLYPQEHYIGKSSKVDIVSGCFFIIRKDVFEKIGFFDEKLFLYYEENVIARKIQNIGMDIIVRNDVTIIHNHSVSIDKTYNKIRKFKILARSQRYFHKNYNNVGPFGMGALYTSYWVTLAISHILGFFTK